MKLFKTIFFFSFCILGNTSLIGQNKFASGKILKYSDSTYIANAHIINYSSKIGVTSNHMGEFSILTNTKDSLVISFIGFETLKIQVSKLKEIIYLKKTSYLIAPFTVFPYKNFTEFKVAFTNLKLKDTIKHKVNPSFMTFSTPNYPINLNGGIVISGPISAIAALFDKRVKDRKHYESLLRKDKYDEYLATKYNSVIIKNSTLLTDKYQINDFMEYCDFSDQFIVSSSHYILIDQIINCFEEYSNSPIIQY